MNYYFSKIIFLIFISVQGIVVYSQQSETLLNDAIKIRGENRNQALQLLHKIEENYQGEKKDSIYYQTTRLLSDIYFNLHNKKLTSHYLDETKKYVSNSDKKDKFYTEIILLESKFYSRFMGCDSAFNYMNNVDTSLLSTQDFKFSFFYTKAITEKICGNYENALQTLELCNSLDIDADFKGRALLTAAQIAKKSKNFNQALSFLEDAKSLIKKNTHAYSVLLSTLGNIFLKMNNFHEAEKIYKQIFYDPNAASNQKLVAINDLSGIYNEKEEYDKAISILDVGEKIAKNDSLHKHLANIYGNKGLTFYQQKKYISAYENFKKCENILNHLNNPDEVDNLVYAIEQQILSLSNVKRDNKDLVVAFGSYISLRDSIERRNLSEQIQEFNTKYETEKKEQKIIILNQEKELEEEKAFRNLILLFVALFLATTAAFFFFRERKSKKLEQQLKRTIAKFRQGDNHRTQNAFDRTLLGLENQLDTTDNVSTKVGINKARSLIQTAAVIHQILRGKDIIQTEQLLIAKPLKQLCSKLKLIFSDAYDIQVDVACGDSIKLNNRVVQPLFLIIEELFTNSWKHAFKEQTNPKIQVSLTKISATHIRLTYRDNGSGLSENINFDKEDSEGLELIRHFTTSLNGEMNLENSNGLTFNFDFQKIDAIL